MERMISRTEVGSAQRYGAKVLADLLAPLNTEQCDRLVAATTGGSTKMLDAVVASLETLGEACKPNLPPVRMLLASSAFEMMVGASWSDDVSFRGQTAAIAQRTAFLIGAPYAESRKQVDRDVRRLYTKGSAVRHGRLPDVLPDEVVELAATVLRVAQALLDRADELTDRQKLDTWVQDMSYATGN